MEERIRAEGIEEMGHNRIFNIDDEVQLINSKNSVIELGRLAIFHNAVAFRRSVSIQALNLFQC